MSVNAAPAGNSQQSQFISSLNDEQKTKFQQGKKDAEALHKTFAGDAEGAKKEQAFADAMKEKDPLKKMKALHDFEKSLTPDEKKALDKMKEDHKSFNDSLSKEQKDKEKDLGKQAMESGHAGLGGVFDLNS